MRQNSDRKFKGLWVRMVVCFFALSGCSTVLVAQQNPDTPPPSTDSTGSQDVKPVVLVMPSSSPDIALLGTDQRYMDLGSLQTRRRTFLLYGMGISESYIQSFDENSANLDTGEFLWSPHIAIINASNHSSFSFQYAPSIMQSTSGPSSQQVFQSGTISFGQPLSPHWVLQLSSANTYGTDTARLLSPPSFTVTGGVPVLDPTTAVFQFNRGDVFTTADSASLSWQKSASQSLSFSAQESYFTSLASGVNSMSTTAEASYSVAVSSRTALNVGGNYFHQSFSTGGCDGYGFSFGVSHQLGRYIDLTVGGGPEFETAPCNNGLGGNYGINIAYPLSRTSRVGLTASRSYTTNYLVNTKWSDTAALTYAKQLSESFQINLNSGYARSVRLQTSLGAYVGYFVGANLSWSLSRTISIATEYRRFAQVSGGPVQGQNMALITLGWNPLPTRIVK